MNLRWRYNSVTTEILGYGNLPNGFSANELDPVSPNVVQETISALTFEALNSDVAMHQDDGQKPYRDSVSTFHFA